MAIWKMKSKTKGMRYKPMVEGRDKKFMTSHTWPTKILAEQEERKLLNLRDEGADSKVLSPLSFSDGSDIWLKYLERKFSAGHVIKTKEFVKKYFEPFLGSRDLKIVDDDDISNFVTGLERSRLSPHSINSIVRSLKAMFNYLKIRNKIRSNPVVLGSHSISIAEKDQLVWSVDEVEQFLNHADKKYEGKLRWIVLAYRIAFNTGCRAGEIIALNKSDIDFQIGRIRFSKSMCNISKCIKGTKTGKTRYAPLSEKLAEELISYIEKNNIVGPLFVNSNGKYHSYFTLNKHYLQDIQEAGVRKTKFHNARRFYCTQFLIRGGVESQLRKIVGHGTVEMTNLYTVQQDNIKALAANMNF